MGLPIGQDRIGNLTFAGQILSLAPSLVTLGGQQYKTATITRNTSQSGALDTGIFVATTFYYVYAVLSGGVVVIVCSASATAPTGFSAYRKVGAFYMDSGLAPFKAYSFGEVNVVTMSAQGDGGSPCVVSNQSYPFVNGNAVRSGTGVYDYTWLSGIFSVEPAMVCMKANSTSSIEGSSVHAVTTTGGQARTNISAGAQNSKHYIFVNKAGVDAVQPDWRI